MNKKEIKVFDAYVKIENEEYYKKLGFTSNDLFKYHNQEVESDGYVRPQKVYIGDLPVMKPLVEDIKTITKYILEDDEKAVLQMYKHTRKQIADLLNSIIRKEDRYRKILYKKFPYDYIFEGEYWDCHLSPFGRCLYTLDGSGEPTCIFCGEPEERK